MSIRQIRIENLREVAADLGGPARLADRLRRTESQISQIIGRNPSRMIGDRLARQIEEILGLEEFELDAPRLPFNATVVEAAEELSIRDEETQRKILEMIRLFPARQAPAAILANSTRPGKAV